MSALTIDTALSKKIEDMSEQILSACYQCGTCTATCPMSVPVRKILRSSQLGIAATSFEHVGLWNCATCRLCEIRCPRGVKIADVIHALRVLGFENRKTPQPLEKALWGVYEEANPWGGSKKDRAKWAEGLDIKYSETKPQKNLLYIGCAVSFDPRLQHIAKSLVQTLKEAHFDFAILGEKENCCGDVVYHIGEEGFLEELVQSNLETFKKTGAEKIITISPHCYNMFRSVYPKFGKTPTPIHYTELLSELVEQGKIGFGNGNGKLEATYHDPCYLGRYHKIYEEPRKILESIPGTSLVEMDDNKENATCCGGGGGMMWNEFIGERPSHQRVHQAQETGASVMVTSCPYCIQNFEDAAKTEGIENLRILDVSEVMMNALRRKS